MHRVLITKIDSNLEVNSRVSFVHKPSNTEVKAHDQEGGAGGAIVLVREQTMLSELSAAAQNIDLLQCRGQTSPLRGC